MKRVEYHYIFSRWFFHSNFYPWIQSTCVISDDELAVLRSNFATNYAFAAETSQLTDRQSATFVQNVFFGSIVFSNCIWNLYLNLYLKFYNKWEQKLLNSQTDRTFMHKWIHQALALIYFWKTFIHFGKTGFKKNYSKVNGDRQDC